MRTSNEFCSFFPQNRYAFFTLSSYIFFNYHNLFCDNFPILRHGKNGTLPIKWIKTLLWIILISDLFIIFWNLEVVKLEALSQFWNVDSTCPTAISRRGLLLTENLNRIKCFIAIGLGPKKCFSHKHSTHWTHLQLKLQ